MCLCDLAGLCFADRLRDDVSSFPQYCIARTVTLLISELLGVGWLLQYLSMSIADVVDFVIAIDQQSIPDVVVWHAACKL